MNYSPDYNMRYRNQNCGCRTNSTTAGGTIRRPLPQEYIKESSPRTAECGCGKCDIKQVRQCIDTFPVGMTYTPWQVWQELYEIDTALAVGTIFRELDYPWEVGRCAKCR